MAKWNYQDNIIKQHTQSIPIKWGSGRVKCKQTIPDQTITTGEVERHNSKHKKCGSSLFSLNQKESSMARVRLSTNTALHKVTV